jgi:prevent-host-death family protein
MREVDVYEAKTSLSALLQAVADGEEIVITRRNKPIARLVAIQPATARPTFGMAKDALDRSGLRRDDIARALEPMTEAELATWGIA